MNINDISMLGVWIGGALVSEIIKALLGFTKKILVFIWTWIKEWIDTDFKDYLLQVRISHLQAHIHRRIQLWKVYRERVASVNILRENYRLYYALGWKLQIKVMLIIMTLVLSVSFRLMLPVQNTTTWLFIVLIVLLFTLINLHNFIPDLWLFYKVRDLEYRAAKIRSKHKHD